MPTPSAPYASVIVITHNRLPYLKRCLESLARQSFEGFEVVVVDDASADGTSDFLRASGQAFVRLDKNAGVSGARNAGIRAARGKILAFTDDDCTLPSDWLARLLAPYQDHSVAGVGGKVKVIPDDYVSFEEGGVNRFGQVEPLHAGEGFHPYLVGCNASFRREALEAIGLFDETFFYGYDESDVCLRLQQRGYKLVFANDALVYHNVMFGGKYRHDKFYWGARSRRHFMLKNFSGRLTVLDLACFEAANAARILFRFLAGLAGRKGRRRIPFAELVSTLQGGLRGYVTGRAFLAAHGLSVRWF